MNKVKSVLGFVLRFGLAFVAMVIAFIISSLVLGQMGDTASEQEAGQAFFQLLMVSLAYTGLLSVLVWYARWYGFKLVLAVATIHFGVETFMSQIETLYFNSSVQMPLDFLGSLVLAGFLRAVIFAPLVVLIFGKFKAPPTPPAPLAQYPKRILAQRIVGISVFYIIIYFLFGYFVAWQQPDLRFYYTGSTDIKPFFQHFSDLFLIEDHFIIPFQFLRGLLWAALALIIVRLMQTPRLVTALTVSMSFIILLTFALVIFPNAFMPPAVAQAHFLELVSSMFVFGIVATWVLYPPSTTVAERSS
jgi:hypothetical protein